MNCLLALCLALGLTANTYEGLQPSVAYQVKAGGDVYAWGGYEKQDMRIRGQRLSAVDLYSVGVGFEHRLDPIMVFIEAGYVMTDDADRDAIRDEIVYTELVANHAVGGRRIPFGDPERDPDSHTSYELGDGVVGRVGVGYMLGDHVTITASYRFLAVKEKIMAWSDTVVETTGGWWQETNDRQLSAFELGIYYRF